MDSPDLVPAVYDASFHWRSGLDTSKGSNNVIPFLALCVALLAAGWSLTHIGDSSRLVLAPAIVICGVLYPPVLIILLFVAYLTPEIMFRGSTSMSMAPWLILATMFVNAVTSTFRQSRLVVPRSAVLWFVLFAASVVIAELNRGTGNVITMDRYLAYPLFFLALWQYKTDFDRRVVILAIIGCSSILAAWMIWRFHQSGNVAWFNRGQAVTDPNYLARWIGIGVIPAFVYLLQWKNKIYMLLLKLPALAVIAVGARAIIRCESRGAGIAIVLMMLVTILYMGYRDRRVKIAAVALIVLVSVAPLVWNSQYFASYRSRYTNESVMTQGNRVKLMKTAVNYWVSESLDKQLLGNGTGSTYATIGSHSHNNFTELLLDYGLFGLAALLGLLWAAWRSANKQVGYFRIVSVAWLVFLGVSCVDLSPFYYIWGWQILALIIPIAKGSETDQKLNVHAPVEMQI